MALVGTPSFREVSAIQDSLAVEALLGAPGFIDACVFAISFWDSLAVATLLGAPGFLDTCISAGFSCGCNSDGCTEFQSIVCSSGFSCGWGLQGAPGFQEQVPFPHSEWDAP